LFNRRRRAREFQDELESNLQMHIEDNLRSGMPPDEARYAALRKFGNMTRVREEAWELWSFVWLEQFWQDIQFGLRMLAKNPGFTAVAVITLALGIGANTAIFSLINAVMLRTLPIQNPQSLFVLKWTARRPPKTNVFYGWGGCPIKPGDVKGPTAAGCSFSYPMFEQVRTETDSFTAVFAFVRVPLRVSIDGSASPASGELVSGEYFAALGVRPVLGRVLGASDDRIDASPAVVLTYSYWKRQFGGAPSVIQKSILVNSIPFTIVGVGPAGFLGLDPGIVQDMWLPLASRARVSQHMPKETDAASWWLMVGAQLKPRITASQAQAPTQVIFSRGVTSGPGAMLKLEDAPHIELVSVAHGLASLQHIFGDPLFLLMAAVGPLLLIACANVASLMLARTAAREKELSVRCALGAKRSRIFRQLLTESLILALAGGLVGIVLAYLSAASLAAFLSANWYTTLEINVQPDFRVLGFTMTVATLTGILFGLAPAVRSTRIDVAPALKESAVSLRRHALAGHRVGLGSALVVAQVALSIPILVGASLLVRTLINLATVNIGFDAHNLVIFNVQPELTGSNGELPELQRKLGAIPGVASVGCSSVPLLSGSLTTRDIFIANEQHQIDSLDVGPNFFETMGIPLLGGRTYNAQDFDGASSKKAKVIIVNQTFARRLLGSSKAVGKLISFEKGKAPDLEIIGVMGDTKYDSLRGAIEPTIYFPMRTQVPFGGTFEVRTALDPKALLPSIRGVVKSLHGDILMSNLMTQTEQIERAMFLERLVTWLSGAFALLALAIACIGLYGLLSFDLTRRTHEVGVRMALGASPAEVFGLILGRGVRLVAVGATIGIAIAIGLTRYLGSLLYGVRPIDPLAYSAVTILLLIVTVSACYIPARRATKVDPMVALRYE
jgi:predicted permease